MHLTNILIMSTRGSWITKGASVRYWYFSRKRVKTLSKLFRSVFCWNHLWII